MNLQQYLQAAKLFQTYDKRVEQDLTVDEAYEEILAEEVRAKRNELISSTDFRVLQDVPWDVAPWIAYRAALRDITEQSTFPESVNWPVPPSDS